MHKRLFLLFSIGLLAFGLVSLVIVSANAGSLEKPVTANLGNSSPDLLRTFSGDFPGSGIPTSSSPQQVEAYEPPPGSFPTQPSFPEAINRPGRSDSSVALSAQGMDPMIRETQRVFPTGSEPEYIMENAITFDLVRERVYGRIDPGALITLTRSADNAYGAAQADGSGFFWTPLFAGNGSGEPVGMDGGDGFDIWVDGSISTVTLPSEAIGALDVVNNLVSGYIPGAAEYTQIYLKVGLWGFGPLQGYGSYGALTYPGGDFSIPLTFDAGAENFVALEYLAAPDVYVRTYFTPDPRVFLIEQNNLIAGYAPPQTTVTATVYSTYPGDIRSVNQGWAQFPFGFYIMDGIEIATGDVVEIEFEDGGVISTTNNPLGNFSFDTDAETVSGWAPSEASVRVNFWDWNAGYIEAPATADLSGFFEADFSVHDLRPSNGVDIMVADENGNQTHMVSGPPYLEVLLDPESEWDCVLARVDGPGKPITLTLETDHGTFVRENPIGPSDPGNLVGGYDVCFLMWGPDWGPVDIAPGDIVTLESDTWQGQIEVAGISWQADTDTDTIFGEAPEGQVGVTLNQWNADHYPAEGSGQAWANSSGSYGAVFTSFDVRDGNGSLEVRHYDPGTDFVTNLQGHMRFMQVEPPAGVYGYTPIPDEGMTVRLYDETDTLLATTGNDGDDNPFYFWYSEFDENPILPGYRVEIESESGWTASVEVPEFSLNADPDTDLVSGEAPKGLLWIDGGNEESGFGTFVPVDGYALSTAWMGYDLQMGDRVFVHYRAQDGNRVTQNQHLCELCTVGLWLPSVGDQWIWGEAQPGAIITITTPYEQFNAGPADPSGNWDIPEPHEFHPGDEVTVAASPGDFPVTFTIPSPLEARADSTTGEVWGQVDDWDHVDVEVNGWWGMEPQMAQTDSEGNFSITLDEMPGGARGHVRAFEYFGVTEVAYLRPYYDLYPAMRANYAHDWVEGEYEPGHTVWITVTDSGGSVKGTTSAETDLMPDWDNTSGYATYYMDWSTGEAPDMVPGDWVYITLENGYANELHLGTIDGDINVDTDVVSGTITVPWLTDPLPGFCGVWQPDAPGMEFVVDPDGGVFECDFSGVGWDLIPGQHVGVNYTDLDNDQVYNVFSAPAPHLWINLQTNGEAAEGGNYTLFVDFNNDGNAPASGTEVSMTLLEGMSYLADTSWVVPSGSGQPGDPLVWQLGQLDPNLNISQNFQVFVQIDAGAGEQIAAEAAIETSTAYYQDDLDSKEAYWEGTVIENNTDLTLDKWAWTEDPLPDSDFVYVLQVCNQSNTASTEVILTDNLPLSTTLITWWGQHPGWDEVSSDLHTLVVSRPTLPAFWCSQVYIKVHLDAAAENEMPLQNQAEVFSSNDLNLDNNSATMDHQVGWPHTNLSIWKNWVSGNLVPGGELHYEFTYQNSGNLTVENVWVTNTLPANTTFLYAYTWDDTSWWEVVPDVITPEYLGWDVGTFQNGYYQNLGVVVQVDPLVEPGAILTHTVEISPQPLEDRYDDNAATWVDIVNPPGPNLRVDKHSSWRWTGEGQLEYELRVLNMGTTRLENVWITDIYPVSTSFHDEWWINHGPEINLIPGASTFDIWVEALDPGETASIGYHIDLDPEIVGEQGLSFTNTVDAPVEGDVFPGDNYDAVTAYTGPDIYIEKWLSDGLLEPGQVVTFTVEFGNHNRWPWHSDPEVGSHITETLPTGMEFISATAPWDPNETWYPDFEDGETVVWGFGPMWSESLWTFEITARINDTVPYGAVLTNRIEAYGDNPDEVEPDWSNNFDEVTFQLEFIKTFLPVVFK